MTKSPLLLFLAALIVLTPSVSIAESFSVDMPSPLKLAKPGHGHIAHFTGIVQLSGQFLVKWDLTNNKRSHLRVVFFPDNDSKALLPHAAGEGPVKELLFPKADQATAILLDSETAQRIFAGELLGARGDATVTISDYRTAVECDHRWYLAELISASKSLQIVAVDQEHDRFGC